MTQVIYKEDKSYNYFLATLNDSPYTKKSYILWLAKYKQFCGVQSYDELLFNEDSKIINNKVIDFIIAERNIHGAANASLHHYLSAIRRFYGANDITLNKVKLKLFVGKFVTKNRGIAYSHSQVAQLLTKADSRMRVAVLLMASAGLRRGGITACSKEHIQQEMKKQKPEQRNFHCLRIGDLTPVSLDTGQKIYKIKVYSYSPNDIYTTWCTSECAESIDKYLQYRANSGEILSDTSPVIREQFDKRQKKNINNPKPLSEKALEWHMYSLVYDSGLRLEQNKKKKTGDRHIFQSEHGLRRFFKTNCTASGVSLRPLLLVGVSFLPGFIKAAAGVILTNSKS